MSHLNSLIARPIAHRGLHDASAGRIENTATAFSAALRLDYGIECDVQVSADGEAMVYHDDALGRLTESSSALAGMSAAAIQAAPFKATTDRILSLSELCELVAGRVPLLIEMKSRFDGDLRLATRAAAVLARYQGPVALMSFDPALVASLRASVPVIVRGIVAMRHYTHADGTPLSFAPNFGLAHLLHAAKTRPQFVAYSVKDLPAPGPWVARNVFGLPLLTWTVRNEDDRLRAARYADQMIFEGFRP